MLRDGADFHRDPRAQALAGILRFHPDLHGGRRGSTAGLTTVIFPGSSMPVSVCEMVALPPDFKHRRLRHRNVGPRDYDRDVHYDHERCAGVAISPG